MAKKTPQLHELIAVEADLTNTAKTITAETITTFTKRPDHFMGQTKTITYYDESRQQENESETKSLVTTVGDKLDHTLKPVIRLYDALLQKEEANQRAKADLVVDGETLAEGLPATYLLGLETRLRQLREVFAAIPTLEPGIIWTDAPAEGKNIFVSPEIGGKRTEKSIRHKVLYEATEQHPAQIEKWVEDTPVAKIATVKLTGMIAPARKAELLERIDRLMRAVKKARQRANTVEVNNLHLGARLMQFIVNG